MSPCGDLRVNVAMALPIYRRTVYHASRDGQSPLWVKSRQCATRKPMSALCQQRTSACLFDHLVGTGEKRWRHGKTKRPSGLKIDHQFKLGRRLHRQIGRLLALEDAIDIAGRLTVLVDKSEPYDTRPPEAAKTCS